MAKNWPCAFETLKGINFDNTMLAAIALKVDADNFSHQQAADWWLSENKSLWQSWIPSQCR